MTWRNPVDKASMIPKFTTRNLVYNDVTWEDEYGSYWKRVPAKLEDGEIMSSEILGSNLHLPILDIDFDAALIPSSTPGHYHLYLDKSMPWRKYKRLLRALRRAGILEPGYVKASIRRRHTAVRLPWIKKKVKR